MYVAGKYRHCLPDHVDRPISQLHLPPLPNPFLESHLEGRRRGATKFRCNLAALWLEHIANDDARSFCDEQPSLSCALSSCPATDEYDFAL
jgi:hypothetical protein